jgi:hypothetical protein
METGIYLIWDNFYWILLFLFDLYNLRIFL